MSTNPNPGHKKNIHAGIKIPTNIDPALRAALLAIKQHLEAALGWKGPRNERFVTVDDLVRAGIVTAKQVNRRSEIVATAEATGAHTTVVNNTTAAAVSGATFNENNVQDNYGWYYDAGTGAWMSQPLFDNNGLVLEAVLPLTVPLATANATIDGDWTFTGTVTIGDLTFADAEELTADLNIFTDVLQGLVPASGGGTSAYLRADGSWQTPPGGGGATDHGALTGLSDDDHTQYSLIVAGAAAPASTPSRVGLIYIETTTPAVYISTGTVDSGDWTQVDGAGGGGVTDHGALTGLGDDDHTQYLLRSILTTQGDLLVQGASEAERLAVGADGTVLTAASGVPTWAVPSGGAAPITLEAAIMADTPVGFWKCDEVSGTTIADSSGNGFDMTIAGTYDLGFTAMVEVDELHPEIGTTSSSAAIVSGSLGLTTPLDGDWTIECVAILRSISNERLFCILANGETEATNGQAMMLMNGGQLATLWEYGGGNNQFTNSGLDSSCFRENTPYHIAAVKDGTANNVSFFVNGCKLAVVSYANEPTGGSSADTCIGGDTGTTDSNKIIGYVAFYDSALTDQRIAEHAQAAGFFGR